MRFLVLLFGHFLLVFSQSCFIVNRESYHVVSAYWYEYPGEETFDIYIKNSHNNPNATIACNSAMVGYDNIEPRKCKSYEKFYPVAGFSHPSGIKYFRDKSFALYELNCDKIGTNCESTKKCWFPSEQLEYPIRNIDKDKVYNTFLVNIYHVCDCDIVGCRDFRDIILSSSEMITFPLGNVCQSCRFTKRSVLTKPLDGSFSSSKDETSSSVTSTSLSASSFSGEYLWKIDYSLSRIGTKGYSFSSPEHRLCVIIPPSPPPSFAQSNVLFPIKSSESFEYFLTDDFSFVVESPSSPCSSFAISAFSNFICVNVLSCSGGSTCVLRKQESALNCVYRSVYNYDGTKSLSNSVSHRFFFVSFAVGAASIKNSSDQRSFEVPVFTHFGSPSASISESFSVFGGNCSPSSSEMKPLESSDGLLFARFSCPSVVSPRIRLFLTFDSPNVDVDGSVVETTISSDLFPVSASPSVYDLNVYSDLDRNVFSSWRFIYLEPCYFDLSVSDGYVVKTQFKVSSPYKLNGLGLSFVSGSVLTVTVSPNCPNVECSSSTVKWSVCFGSKPEIADFSCDSCYFYNGKSYAHKLNLDISFSVREKGVVCDAAADYLHFEFAGSSITSQYSSNYSFSLPFETDISDQSHDDVPQSLKLNGFPIEFDPIFLCIVPLPSSIPVLYVENYSIQSDLSFSFSFSAVSNLFSTCFDHGHYSVMFRSYHDSDFKSVETITADEDKQEFDATIDVTEPNIYYYYVDAVNAVGESRSSVTKILHVCQPFFSQTKAPILLEPNEINLSAAVELLSFSWTLPSETISLRCSPSEIAFLILELEQTSIYEETSQFSESFVVSILSSHYELSSGFLLQLSTKYSWRLTVSFQVDSDSPPQTLSSSVSTFLTTDKHCFYLNCNNHGICDEIDIKCICHSGYEGEFCETISGLSIGALVGIVVGVLCFVLLLLVVGFFLLFRFHKRKIRLPDFTPFMFTLLKSDDSHDFEALQEIIRNDPSASFEWAIAFLESVDMSQSDRVCAGLVYAYERNGEGLNLIIRLIEHEVSQASQTNTLFRNNSFATKCFKVYNRMVGLPYLYRVLFPLLNKLTRDEECQAESVKIEGKTKYFEGTPMRFSESYELNPNTIDQNDEDMRISVQTNCISIQLACQLFLTSLNRTSSFCPREFHNLCSFIKDTVSQKFSEARIENSISAFMFLRYFVAALTVPESFGLFPNAPSGNLRRQLIMISKVLSNLSTSTKFGSKEEYMTIMNEFLEEHKDSLKEYADFLCEFDDESSVPIVPVKIPSKYYNAALQFLEQIRLEQTKTIN